MKRKRDLKNDEFACGTYKQVDETCKKCVRNIGFWNAMHQFLTYQPKMENNKVKSCEGYLE